MVEGLVDAAEEGGRPGSPARPPRARPRPGRATSLGRGKKADKGINDESIARIRKQYRQLQDDTDLTQNQTPWRGGGELSLRCIEIINIFVVVKLW